jgi:hypothetical protein
VSAGDPFDPARLTPAPVIPSARERRPPRHKPGEKFLKGPVPWRWIEAAGKLPGKALAVGLAAWREAGCRRARTVPLNLSALAVPRRTAQRGLTVLEGARLVSVERRKGRPPLVTLLDAPPTGHSETPARSDAEGDR